MMSLGEDYQKEQARCRALLSEYKAIGPAGVFGADMIEATLKEANQAVIEGDLPKMIEVYQRMQEHC